MLFRTTTKDHEACGYEVTLDAREQRLSLRRLAGEATVLAQTTAEIPMARRVPLKIQFEGARLRVWLGNDLQPVLDATDPKPWLVAGQVGIRSWGSALSVDDLILYPGMNWLLVESATGPFLAATRRRPERNTSVLPLMSSQYVRLADW